MEIQIPHNYVPRPYQRALYNCIPDGFRRAVAVWHRRAGKDKTMLNICVREACKSVGTYFYVFPEYNQGRKVLWDGRGKDGLKHMDHFPPEIRRRTLNQEMMIELVNGSVFQIIGSDRIDAIMGTNPRGIVFSEFSLQKPAAWDYLRPILLENDGWAIFNFTPRGRNHGWDIYQTAVSQPSWFSELLTIEDTGVLTRADMDAERAAGMSDEMILQEYYCDFTVSSDRMMIPLEIIMHAAARSIPERDYYHAPKILGVDIARGGGDRSAMIKRQGLAAFDLVRWDVSKRFPVAENADRIATVMLNWEPDMVFVDSQPGFAVVEELRRRGFENVQPVDFAGSPSDALYVNKRTEMYAEAGKWLREGGCIPDDQKLIRNLANTPFSYNSRDQLQLWSKDKIRAEYGESPDDSDALALTWAARVQPRRVTAHPVMASASDGDVAEGWNPLYG